MKRLALLLNVILFLLFACKNDETLVVLNTNAAPSKITTSVTNLNTIIQEKTLGNSLEIDWSKTDYGVATQVTYTVELDSKCNTFVTPVVLGTTNSTNMSVLLGDLNSKLIGNLHVAPGSPASVQIRVTATVNDKYKTISIPVAFTVTPYSDKPVALWLGENSPAAPVLYSTGAGTYEGYRYITSGSTFRLTASPVCTDSVYGAGTTGKLAAGAAAPLIKMGRQGYYKINVDLKNLTFDTLFINTWGAIGTSTPHAWDASTPMTYNSDNDTWEATLSLASGALKFRANDDWGVNYGPAVIADLAGTLVSTNDAINIPEPAVYKIVIDFSQSKAPYKYVYTVTKNSDVPEPAKLWLPGGYEGYNPAAAPTIYAINDHVYEGYVYISQGTGFKFTSAPDYNHINYGDSGSPGVLTTNGLAPDLSLGVAGYYKLVADITNLTYQTYLVNTWGMIGTATPGQWDNSTAMTYDPATQLWSSQIDLVPGALKFRANNAWDLNYGPASSTDLDGTLIQTNDAITINDAATYIVTLDFRRTAAPYQYVYTVKKK